MKKQQLHNLSWARSKPPACPTGNEEQCLPSLLWQCLFQQSLLTTAPALSSSTAPSSPQTHSQSPNPSSKSQILKLLWENTQDPSPVRGLPCTGTRLLWLHRPGSPIPPRPATAAWVPRLQRHSHPTRAAPRILYPHPRGSHRRPLPPTG